MALTHLWMNTPARADAKHLRLRVVQELLKLSLLAPTS